VGVPSESEGFRSDIPKGFDLKAGASLSFLSGGGELAALIESRDWSG
jgi:hypothetical protein